MKNNQEICDIVILVSKRDYIGNEIVLCEDKEGYYIPFDKKQYLSIKFQKENFNINELPIQAIKDCLKYCENHQIYDKLSKYGDFYYKLNTFLKDNHLN